jgi:3-oxoacyl-[acyl-carrier-protein] synthase II
VGRDPSRKKVVVTGIGLETCLGSHPDIFWERLLAGESGIGFVTQFDPDDLPCKIAGEIRDFDDSEYIDPKDSRRMSRASRLGLVAALRAIEDAGLSVPLPNPGRVGVYFGTAIGGWDRGYEGIETLRTRGLSKVNPFVLPATLPNMVSFHVSQVTGAAGPNTTITTACATGTQTVGEAAQAIRNGWADLIVAGGTEAIILHFIMAGFCAMRALPTNYNDDPTKASRPFDADREGFILSEGSACLILESIDHAMARNARVYAEVAGFASSSDAFHITAPDPSGEGAMRTMRLAIQDARIQPDEIDYINAHGTSTPANDATETMAIKKLFGERAFEIPISSTKSMLGHAMGASGAIEAITSILTIQNDAIHPTINYEHPDPDLDLDYVPNVARKAKVNTVLSNSFGLGGQNACLVIRRLEQ